MNDPSHFVPWDTPFAGVLSPSVALLTEALDRQVVMVVAPGGVERCPKFLVRFERVAAFLSYEEAFCFDREYPPCAADQLRKMCAFEWKNSPWMRSYVEGQDFFHWKDLRHHCVFGGDSTVEVLADGPPSIEMLQKPMVIEIEQQI